VASFDGLRPLLVTSHCSLRSLANKLRSFVRSGYRKSTARLVGLHGPRRQVAIAKCQLF